MRAELFWQAPVADGGAAITNHQTKVKKVYKKLQPDKKHRVKVRAVNGAGSGPVGKEKFRTKAKSWLFAGVIDRGPTSQLIQKFCVSRASNRITCCEVVVIDICY